MQSWESNPAMSWIILLATVIYLSVFNGVIEWISSPRFPRCEFQFSFDDLMIDYDPREELIDIAKYGQDTTGESHYISQLRELYLIEYKAIHGEAHRRDVGWMEDDFSKTLRDLPLELCPIDVIPRIPDSENSCPVLEIDKVPFAKVISTSPSRLTAFFASRAFCISSNKYLPSYACLRYFSASEMVLSARISAFFELSNNSSIIFLKVMCDICLWNCVGGLFSIATDETGKIEIDANYIGSCSSTYLQQQSRHKMFKIY
jgi:hypothetical protein